MFRRFIDLSLSKSVPDHSSIWRFRQLLNAEGLLEPLLQQINTHLEPNSIIVAVGSINIIDATVIIAADGKRKTTYGFKAHVNTDEDGFVKNMTYTKGSVHD